MADKTIHIKIITPEKIVYENDIDAVYGDVHFVRNSKLDKCVRYYSSKRFSPKILGIIIIHSSFILLPGLRPCRRPGQLFSFGLIMLYHTC